MKSTGSSARELRRGGVNLLGGRARTTFLHPLTSFELGPVYRVDKAADKGLLPSIYFSDDPQADLEAYYGAYLQQEIMAEGATRNNPSFSRFLRAKYFSSGNVKAARDLNSSASFLKDVSVVSPVLWRW